jgi:hypothetical protein
MFDNTSHFVSGSAGARCPTSGMLRARRAILMCVLLGFGALAWLHGPSPASAAGDQITAFGASSTSTLPGSHGDLSLNFAVRTRELENTSGDGLTYLQPQQLAKKVTFDLPPGYLADPTAVPSCPDRQIRTTAGCPLDTQVGILELRTPTELGYPDTDVNGRTNPYLTEFHPIFNMTRDGDTAARLGVSFVSGQAVLNIKASIRDDGDYGVRATLSNIPSALSCGGSPGLPSTTTTGPRRRLT